ncbi:MAG: hypothetical protein H0U75_10465 [Legionella sp.]|nr:hypothetical protein [Legionella sp.]
MKLIYRLAGALLGGIKGMVIAPTLPWIITGKNHLHKMACILLNAINLLKPSLRYLKEGKWGHFLAHNTVLLLIGFPIILLMLLTWSLIVLISVVLLTILMVPMGCIYGLYIGFKGGLLANGDKKAPALNVYQVARACYYLYFEDRRIADESIKNYLAGTYHGFSDLWPYEPNSQKVILLELLQDPKSVVFVKDVLAHISCDDYLGLGNSYPLDFFYVIEFIDIKNKDFLNYLLCLVDAKQTKHSPTAQVCAKRFLIYLLNQQLIAPTDMPDDELLQELYNEVLVNFIKIEILTPNPTLKNTDLGDFCYSKLYDRALFSNEILAFFDQRGPTKQTSLDPHESQNNAMLI